MSVLLIAGGRVVDPSQGLDRVCDVRVVDGRVAGFADSGTASGPVDQTIDARGKIVRITARGRKAREAGAASVRPGMLKLIEILGADEFARALPFLVKLRQVLDAARD